MFRREARLFSQIAHAEKFEVEKNVENVQFDYVADLAASDTNYESVKDQITINIEKSRKRQMENFENRKQKGAKVFKFEKGMLVLVKNLRKPKVKGCHMEHNWIGPYTINEIKKSCASVINKQDKKIKKLVSLKHLKPYFQTPVKVKSEHSASDMETCTDIELPQDMSSEEDLPTKNTSSTETGSGSPTKNTSSTETGSEQENFIQSPGPSSDVEVMDCIEGAPKEEIPCFHVGDNVFVLVPHTLGLQIRRVRAQILNKVENAYTLATAYGILCSKFKTKQLKKCKEHVTVNEKDQISLSQAAQQESVSLGLVITKSTLKDISEDDIRAVKLLNHWLTDQHMTAASTLLCRQFPHIGGLNDTLLADTLTWPIPNRPFIQILNKGGNHWITISNLGCVENEVNVYDSLDIGNLPDLNAICDLLRSKSSQVIVNSMNVCQQEGSSNCGPYAIAFATTLCFGGDPTQLKYKSGTLRQHIYNCLVNQEMTQFESHSKKREKKVSCQRSVDIYCECRKPQNNQDMISCASCLEKFHTECVQFSISKQPTGSNWFCNVCINNSRY